MVGHWSPSFMRTSHPATALRSSGPLALLSVKTLEPMKQWGKVGHWSKTKPSGASLRRMHIDLLIKGLAAQSYAM